VRDCQKLWVYPFVALVLIICLSAVRADSPFEVGNNIRVEAATATPARQGGVSRIRFRVVNDSGSSLHVLGIETPVASDAKLVARIGDAVTTVLESIGVPAGESVDLTTSHLWFEVEPMVRDLVAGETFEMTIMFVGARLATSVHVHEAVQEGR